MAVYVDNERISWRGRQWCHLVADTLAELHTFAAALGLRRAWFQESASHPHYDVTVAVRERALRMGALPADKTLLVACCKKLRTEFLALRTQSPPSLTGPNSGSSTWTASSFNAQP